MNKNHLPSAALLLVSGSGALLSFGASALLAALGLIYLALDSTNSEVVFISFALAWESALVGLLALPAAVASVYRLMDKSLPRPPWPRWLDASPALILTPFLIGGGYLFSRLAGAAWLILPPLQILALGIPIWWLVSASGRGFLRRPDWQNWKLLSVALMVTNPLILFLELAVFLFAGVIWIASRPDFSAFIQSAANQVMSSNFEPQMANAFISDLLGFPGVIAALFISVSLAAPLIEEVLKTSAVWFLLKKEFSPAHGFAAGALCGAAFALAESLGALSRPFDGATWALVVVGRVGTGIMHILASGLTGWGIASLASGGKFGRTLLGYLAAVILHGLWNFTTIAAAVNPYLDPADSSFGFIQFSGQAGMAVVAFLAVLYLGGILWINRRLRPTVGLKESYEVQ